MPTSTIRKFDTILKLQFHSFFHSDYILCFPSFGNNVEINHIIKRRSFKSGINVDNVWCQQNRRNCFLAEANNGTAYRFAWQNESLCGRLVPCVSVFFPCKYIEYNYDCMSCNSVWMLFLLQLPFNPIALCFCAQLHRAYLFGLHNKIQMCSNSAHTMCN